MSRNDDLGYPIVVAPSIRSHLRRFITERYGEFVVLCDRNLAATADRLTRGIRGKLGLMPFDLGEKRKRLITVERVLDALTGSGAQRATTVVGVGGGVAADVFGLAASLYMRGIAYVGVATSLVAMVDGAIGGKTAVNLQRGKNLAGTFADPRAVFCHVDALQMLPYRRLRDGLAEIVKAAILEGGEFFDLLEHFAAHRFPLWPWEQIVEEAIKVKTMLVGDDRLETGAREALNLGHTFAHAIERASRYRISHGAAVAVGLRTAGLLSLATGRFSRADHARVLTLLALLGLPLRAPALRPTDILTAMEVDKKRRDGRLRFVLPLAIGDVEPGVEVPTRALRRAVEACVTQPTQREFV